MPTVTADITHPAAYSYRHVEIGNTLYEATRVFAVSDLSSGPANTFTSRAQQASGIPGIGDFHPDPIFAAAGCVVRGLRTQPNPNSDDACYVFVDYWTIIPQFTGGVGVISVERDASLSFETGDKFYSPSGTGEQITVYQPRKADGSRTPSQPVPAERSVGLPLRKMIITCAVTQKNLSNIESQVGSVNGDAGNWFGLPRGYWRFDRMRDTTQLGSGTIICVTEFLTRNVRNWHAFEVRRSEMTGQPLTVYPDDMNSALGLIYTYGVTRFPGVTVVGDYPPVTFGSGGLFGRSSYP